jgi:phenylacetate-CoA ligase
MSIKKNYERLDRIVRRARRDSPFYRKHLPAVEITGPEDLRRLPFLEKEHVNRHSLPAGRELFTGPLENCIVVASSGSTGSRKYMVLEREAWEKSMEVQEQALRYLGLGRGDTIAILSAAGPFDPTLSSLIELTFRLGCVVLPVTGNAEIDELIDYLVSFRPNAVYIVPSFALRIAARVCERGLKIDLKKFFYVGEHLGREASERLKEVFGFEELWAVGYSSADTGLIGFQDRNSPGTVYHVAEELNLVEILDPQNGRPCACGETGEIVVSNCHRNLFPLIRFRTGDLGYWIDPEENAPSLGRRLALLGRGDDEIMIRAMSVPTTTFVEPVRNTPIFSGVMQIVIGLEEGLTVIDVRAECNDPAAAGPDAHAARAAILAANPPLRQEIEDEGVVLLRVTPVESGSLPTTVSGKVRLVQDRRIES